MIFFPTGSEIYLFELFLFIHFFHFFFFLRILSEPAKENLEDPLRKTNGADSSPQNVPITENAINHQHLEDEKEKPQTVDQPKEPSHM